jgi:hypothetical protein
VVRATGPNLVPTPVTARPAAMDTPAMSTIDPGTRVSGRIMGPQADFGAPDETSGSGWLLFAGIILALVGVLNVIYGIAAIAESSFFVEDTRYIISGLNTWGWFTLGLGALQLLACFSVIRGGQFGRWFGIAVAGVHAIVALLSLPAYPFWSLAVFAIDLMIIYGLAVYGGRGRAS